MTGTDFVAKQFDLFDKSFGQTMYRSIAHTSQVDESLFGKDSGALTKGRKTVTGPLAPSSIVISVEELNRIRVRTSLSVDPIFMNYVIIDDW